MLERSLFCLLEDNDTLARTRNGTGDANNAQFGVDQSDLQVLNGYLLVAHVTGHLLTLKNLLRVHLTDGARAAVAAATVCLAAAVEVVAFDCTGPTLTLAVASYVDNVAN